MNYRTGETGEITHASLPAYRILVVDDEPVLCELITTMLEGVGHHVDAAEDGAAAWESLQTQRYDLLLTDQNMPKVTGVELVRKLRSAHMTMPVIMVAGILPTDEVDKAPSLQLAAILSKPFLASELLDVVENVLRKIDRPHEGVHSQPM